MSRHDLAAVPMAAVRPSATALGIYRHTFSGSRSPVAVCQRAALLIGLPALLTAAQVFYRVLPASDFHGWERPNIAGGLSCTAWELPCFWPLRVGGFRLYTLRRAQPLSMCRHTGAGHSCRRFRLYDRRASCPFSGPVRRSWVAGIVSFHSQLLGLWSKLHLVPARGLMCLPHGGRDPPARMCGLTRSCGIYTPASAGVEEEIEEANGSAGAYAPTIIKSYFLTFVFYILCSKIFPPVF